MGAHITMSSYSASNGRVSVTHASLHIGSCDAAAPSEGECFDPQTCCDEQERKLIEQLRTYLRPQCAPACLIERLHRVLDSLDSLESAVEAPQELTDTAHA